MIMQPTKTRQLISLCLIFALVVTSGCSSSSPEVTQLDQDIVEDVRKQIAERLTKEADVVDRHGDLVSIETRSVRRLPETNAFDLHFPPRLVVTYFCVFDKYSAKVDVVISQEGTGEMHMQPFADFAKQKVQEGWTWEQRGEELWLVQDSGVPIQGEGPAVTSVQVQSLIEFDVAHPDFVAN